MLIYREASFVPVAAVCLYDDNDNILALGSDADRSLAACIHTRDICPAMRLSKGCKAALWHHRRERH